MTEPATVDFTVYRGARFFKTFTIDEDWTGYTVYMQARYEKTDSDPITGWNLNSDGSEITLTPGASSSTFTVDVAHGVTAALDKPASYDILAEDGSGNRNFYFQGILRPDDRITQVA